MELRRYLRIVRKWLWLIVVGTLLAGGLAYVLTPQLPPVYRAATSLYVRASLAGTDAHDNMLVNRYLSVTYRELITKRPIIETAGLNLNLAPSAIAKIASKVTVWVVPDTSVIRLAVEDSDPHLAADLANEIVSVFVQAHGGSESESGMDISVVETASQPTEPSASRKPLNTLVAAIGGCVLATGAAFLIEYLDDTLATAEDIHRNLSLPTLAAIPRPTRRRGRDTLPIDLSDPSSSLAEACRALYARLQFANANGRSAANRLPSTMLVTSPSSTREKANIAVNLGIVMAQAGLKVLLVDADLQQPHLHRIFGLTNTSGITTLLAGSRDGQGSISHTDIPNLSVLPSGPLPEPSTLSSQQLPQLVTKLKAHADIVLFDGPPVLLSADAMVLAALAEGTLLAVESDATQRQAAVQAMERLRGVQAEMLGAVINGA